MVSRTRTRSVTLLVETTEERPRYRYNAVAGEARWRIATDLDPAPICFLAGHEGNRTGRGWRVVREWAVLKTVAKVLV